MNDERFERSADMRLVDLQREALGVASTERRWTRIGTDLPHTSGDADEERTQHGTIVTALLDAQPRTGLIPGALVTVSLALINEGDTPATGVRVVVPVPAETRYHRGTLAIDGNHWVDDDALALTGEGLDLADIGPGQRRTIQFKVSVDAGVNAVTFTPHVAIAAGAVVGARSMRLDRGAAPAAPPEPERPFYELDEAEEALEPAPAPEPEPLVAVVQPAEMPPPPAPPMAAVVPIGAPPEAARPEAVAAAAETIATPAAPPAPPAAPPPPQATLAHIDPPPPVDEPVDEPIDEPIAEPARPAEPPEPGIVVVGEAGPVLTVGIDRKRLTTLQGLFATPRSLGMIAHYLVLNALAATVPLPGDGDGGETTAFVVEQERLLSRAMIATRLGKTVLPESVAASLPPFPPRVRARTDRVPLEPAPPGELSLVRAFRESEVLFLGRMLANADAPPFLRAAQLFVGLCATDAAIRDADGRRRLGTALAAYASLAAAEINRIFLRAKLTRTPALFKETDKPFDDAARTVLAALDELLG